MVSIWTTIDKGLIFIHFAYLAQELLSATASLKNGLTLGTIMQNKMKKFGKQSIAALLAVAALTSAHAGEVLITPGNPLWSNPPSENSGGGSSTITGTMARSGNGSLEMTGDRTREFGLGNPYSSASNLGLLDQLSQLTFDWAIAASSVATLNPDYTPALRVVIFDGNVRSELIWEGAYNGTYGNTNRATWYSSGVNDLFYRNVAGAGGGVTLNNGSQVNLSLSDWEASPYYSNNAYISGFSVGVGSSAGAGYRSFADNITIGLNGATTTYNFELAAADVPEPGSLALIGLGLIGAAVARRKQRG